MALIVISLPPVSESAPISPKHLHELARAGRAATVHRKLLYVPHVVDSDDFAVLTADVDNSAGLREEGVGASRMAGDFRDCALRDIKLAAAIAGADRCGHIIWG